MNSGNQIYNANQYPEPIRLTELNQMNTGDYLMKISLSTGSANLLTSAVFEITE
jgi:hypothetical protein